MPEEISVRQNKMLSLLQEAGEKKRNLEEARLGKSKVDLEDYLQEAEKKALRVQTLVDTLNGLSESGIFTTLPLPIHEYRGKSFRVVGDDLIHTSIEKGRTRLEYNMFLLSDKGELFTRRRDEIIATSKKYKKGDSVVDARGITPLEPASLPLWQVESLNSKVSDALRSSVFLRREELARRAETVGITRDVALEYNGREQENALLSGEGALLVEEARTNMLVLDKIEIEIKTREEEIQLKEEKDSHACFEDFCKVVEEFVANGFVDSPLMKDVPEEMLPFNFWGLWRSKVFAPLKEISVMRTGVEEEKGFHKWMEMKMFMVSPTGDLLVGNYGRDWLPESSPRDPTFIGIPRPSSSYDAYLTAKYLEVFPHYFRSLQPSDLIDSEGKSIAPILSELLYKKAEQIVSHEEGLIGVSSQSLSSSDESEEVDGQTRKTVSRF